MKNIILFIAVIFVVSFTSTAQGTRIDQNTRAIRTELSDWDQIRGGWLASSLIAMSNNQPTPDRTFPEKLTASQLFAFVPADIRVRVLDLLN